MQDNRYGAAKYKTKNPLARILIWSFQKTIVDLLSDIDYQSLHEVGCGDGYNMQVLTSIKEAEYSGSDIEEGALILAKKRNPRVDFLKASVYNLPFPEDSFDIVVICEVLEHLKNPQKALSEVKRITKKYCLLSIPNEPLWRILNMARGAYWKNWGNTPGHINHWSKKQFIHLVSQYFEIDKVKNPLPWTLILTHK
jgi:ubiquinone/menaquinone biosynthesis C-methylase UbiE